MAAQCITSEKLRFAYADYPQRRVLDGLDFEVEEGTITALAGPSGCGKSTLCQILTGVIPACIDGDLQGRVCLEGRELAGRRPAELAEVVGYVMQDPDRQIIASAVEDELAFGPENLCLPPAEIRRRVDETLELLALTDLAEADPARLSGGQKQLVAIGAVLTMAPRILIMDEPFSFLDDPGRSRLAEILTRLRQQGRTVLVVDHDYEALDFVDRLLWMEGGKVSEH
ncbi:MAG: energy-coupling factor ABC transporter ATP-binding protein [Anaerovoracaceae bacterium]|jgi:energy-coupling factor transport system ATP-binding protein